MGRLFLVEFDQTPEVNFYCCRTCQAHIALSQDCFSRVTSASLLILLSRNFQERMPLRLNFLNSWGFSGCISWNYSRTLPWIHSLCFLFCFWGGLPFETWHHIVSWFFERKMFLKVILDFSSLNQECFWFSLSETFFDNIIIGLEWDSFNRK